MLHIVILNKNYFPEKLGTSLKTGDKVIIIATLDGSIPVSAYRDESLKNMEVKLLPEIKDTSSQDGRNLLRIAQAMLIGQLTASVRDFEIYTDDAILDKALIPFTGTRRPASRKKAQVKITEPKAEPVEEEAPAIEEAKEEPKVKEIPSKKDVKKASETKKSQKAKKTDAKSQSANLPSQAEVKRVLGAANSSYAKPIMEVIRKSNQITFEMDLRMKLVEAGMDPTQCQELARSLNEEFGKMLPASM